VDDELLKLSSFTLIRPKDLASALSLKVASFIEEHNIELITHEQLIKELY